MKVNRKEMIECEEAIGKIICKTEEDNISMENIRIALLDVHVWFHSVLYND